MIKQLSHFMACVLLVLMPLQAVAAAKMLVCNSMLQNSMMHVSAASKQIATADANIASMPCHQHTASQLSEPKQLDTVNGANHSDNNNQIDSNNYSESKKHSESKNHCDSKNHCATVCANFCALTVLNMPFKPSFALISTQAIDFNHQVYASITQVSLQRPPIFFI